MKLAFGVLLAATAFGASSDACTSIEALPAAGYAFKTTKPKDKYKAPSCADDGKFTAGTKATYEAYTAKDITDFKDKAAITAAMCAKGYSGTVKAACTDASKVAKFSGCTKNTGTCATKKTGTGSEKAAGVTGLSGDAIKLGATITLACKDGDKFGGKASTYTCIATGATTASWAGRNTCTAGIWTQSCPLPKKGTAASDATIKAIGAKEGTQTKPTAKKCAKGGDKADPQCENKKANNPGAGKCAKSTDTGKSDAGATMNDMTCKLNCGIKASTACTPADLKAGWVANAKAGGAGSPAAAYSMVAAFVLGLVSYAL